MSQTNNALEVLKQQQPTLQAITMFNYGPDRDVSSIVMNEISCLENLSIAKPELLSCEPISIIMGMKYVLKNNLTLDSNAGLVYTTTRNVAMAKDQLGNVTKWGKVMEVQPTCEGLLSIAYQCGKIIDHERPTVKKDGNGKVIEVTFKYMKPSPAGPRWVEVTFDESDFGRWKNASAKQNKGNANANYTSFNGGLDPEFARAKSIKHALKKLGTNPNERLMVNIQPTIKQTIDPAIENEIAKEEITFTEAVEVPNEQPQPTEPQPQATQPQQPTSNNFSIPNL